MQNKKRNDSSKREVIKMKRLVMVKPFILMIMLFSCESLVSPIKEMPDGYQMQKDNDLSVILQTSLSSNANQRGDQFIALLKEPIILSALLGRMGRM